jgi:hypothetical protein
VAEIQRETIQDEYYQEHLEDCEFSLGYVKQFLYILYGSCVRFYSTVVEWEFLQQMKEDLIEQLTSMVFADREFSMACMTLCEEITAGDQETFDARLAKLGSFLPVQVGVDAYLTLDSQSNIEQVFRETTQQAPENDSLESGDVGGSSERKDSEE